MKSTEDLFTQQKYELLCCIITGQIYAGCTLQEAGYNNNNDIYKMSVSNKIQFMQPSVPSVIPA